VKFITKDNSAVVLSIRRVFIFFTLRAKGGEKIDKSGFTTKWIARSVITSLSKKSN